MRGASSRPGWSNAGLKWAGAHRLPLSQEERNAGALGVSEWSLFFLGRCAF